MKLALSINFILNDYYIMSLPTEGDGGYIGIGVYPVNVRTDIGMTLSSVQISHEDIKLGHEVLNEF